MHRTLRPSTRRMPHRAASIGALAFAVPALVSCGFDEATNTAYTPGVGTYERSDAVDVLGAAVVSTEGGEGTFVAGFSNASASEPATVDGIGGAITAEGFEPLELPAGGFVNLGSGEQGIPVSGDFEIGQFVEVQVGYGDGQGATLEVPVVPNAGDYAGIDGPVPTEFEDFPVEELYTPADEVVPEGTVE